MKTMLVILGVLGALVAGCGGEALETAPSGDGGLMVRERDNAYAATATMQKGALGPSFDCTPTPPDGGACAHN